jgi:hypothetical protein
VHATIATAAFAQDVKRDLNGLTLGMLATDIKQRISEICEVKEDRILCPNGAAYDFRFTETITPVRTTEITYIFCSVGEPGAVEKAVDEAYGAQPYERLNFPNWQKAQSLNHATLFTFGIGFGIQCTKPAQSYSVVLSDPGLIAADKTLRDERVRAANPIPKF